MPTCALTQSQHETNSMTIDRTSPAPGIKEVAKRAGVSPGTVSNALNRPERVAEATRERVLAAIRETGFVPNASASRLRALDNRAIGILVIDVGNLFHTSLARAAQRVADDRGFQAMLCDGDREPERMCRLIEFLESQRVAGVLATGSSLPGVGERLDALRRRGAAVVLVDAPTTDPGRCSVAMDDVHGGEIVGEHLLEVGRRRISYVEIEYEFAPFEDRLRGLRHAVGDRADINVVRVPVSELEDERVAADAVIAAGSDAVFCMNDHVAFSVLRGLQERGIRVPDDVAVVGYDDNEFASMMATPLTSVRQSAQLLGETAARLLLEECADEDHVHQHITYQPRLVARASTLGHS